MRVLALETATEACSVALWLDGAVCERHEVAPRGHAERVLAMMEAVLAEGGVALQDLDGLGFGRGPGAFTGVRIAAGVAQGAAFGAGLPVVPVSTLAALARGVQAEGTAARVLAAIDARKGEVYWGAYRAGRDGGVERVDEECVTPPEQVPLPEGDSWFGAGTGWGTYHVELSARLGNDRLLGWEDDRLPHARDVAALAAAALARGEGLPAESAVPVYLRDKVAEVRTG